MNKRIKEIRKSLKLNQEDFGKKLGVTKTAISKMELGTYNVTDTMIKLICREFSVNYIWLTSGIGEKYFDYNTTYVDIIERILSGDNDFAKNVFKMFAKFTIEDWKSLEHMIDLYLESGSEKKPGS